VPSSLRVLAQEPRLRLLLPLNLLGRVQMTALPVAMSFLIAGWTGAYSVVGVITGGMAAGQAFAGPLRGRLADRGSPAKLLITTGWAYGVLLLAIVLVTLVVPSRLWPLSVVLSFVTGLTLPPVSQLGRALWPRLVQGEAKDALYTVEAVGYQAISVGGPLLSSFVIVLGGAGWAVALCAVMATGGAIGFALAVRRAGFDGPPSASTSSAEDKRSLLRSPAFVRALVVSMGLMATLFAVDLSVIAWGRQTGHPTLAGAIVALLALGSVVGGLAMTYVARKMGLPMRLLALTAVVGLLALLLTPSFDLPVWVFLVAAVIVGIPYAPALAAGNARIGELAPPARMAEAFGWLATASTLGAAIALPVTGALLDHTSPAVAVAVAAATTAVTTVVAFTVPTSPKKPAEEAAKL